MSNKVKIYTKTGDAGETALFGGARVPKDDPRVAAYGDVDELNATLGFARALEPEDFARDLVVRIQGELFTIGAELASREPAKLARALPRPLLGVADVTALENAIDGYEAELAPLQQFILPGGTPKSACFHLARTVCRRAERTVVRLGREMRLNPALLPYLNRLSDLLFVLARAVDARAGRADTPW